MIRAVVFDMAGTLVQNEQLKAISYARAVNELCNNEVAKQEVLQAFQDVVERSRQEVALHLIEKFGLEKAVGKRVSDYGVSESWQALVQLRLSIYERMLADPEVIRKNVWPKHTTLLEVARKTECKVGLATMSNCRQVKTVLEALDLTNAFDFVAGRDDIEHGKPDPEIYLLVARQLGVNPSDCLVIESSPTGVQAALAAGMHCVAVSTPFTQEALHASGLIDSRHIIDDHETLPDIVKGIVEEQQLFKAPEIVIPDSERLKHEAVWHAVELIKPGMIVGLGHGGTTNLAVTRISELLRAGKLANIRCIPCSFEAEAEARSMGIPLTSLDENPVVDLTIDSADEVDRKMNLIKGGGALLLEKIVAQASRREVIVMDESKLSKHFSAHSRLPIEVVPFAWRAEAKYLESLGARVSPRREDDRALFETDQGNLILDCEFDEFPEPEELAALLETRAGIVEHGLFIGLATDLFVAGKDGVHHLKRKSKAE